MLGYPTQSTPGGCLIGAIGFFSCLYGAVCIFMNHRLRDRELSDAEREFVSNLGWHAGISITAGIALIWFGYKLAVNVGAYDSRDPNEPMLKF